MRVSIQRGRQIRAQVRRNDTVIVPADFVLVSIGQKIEWGNLLDGTNVKLNKNNTVAVDEFYVTGDKNIIAGATA